MSDTYEDIGIETKSGFSSSASTPDNKVFKNSLYNSGAWTTTVLISLLATPYIVNKLSLEGYGIYALLTGLVGYYGLLDLGLGQGVIKFAAQYKAIGDDESISRSINAALWVQIVAGLIGSAVLVIFAEPILTLFRVSSAFLIDAKLCLYMSAIGFLFKMISQTLSSVLMGLQRYDITSKVSVVTNFLLILFIVLVLYHGGGLKEIIFLTVVSTFIVCVIYFFILRQKLPQWRFSFVLDKVYFKVLFSFSIFLFISRVSSLFNNYIVCFVVGFFLGPAAITFYIVPSKIINAFGGLLSNAFGVLFPFASELGSQKNMKKVQKTFVEGSKIFAALSIPVFLMIFIFSKPILLTWMGTEFAEKGWLVLSLLAISSLIGSLTTVPNLITMGLGYSKVIGIFSIFTVVFYIVLLPSFTKFWGIQGTAVAMLVATIPGITLVGYECSKIIHVEIWHYAKNVISFHIIPLAASLFYVILFKNFEICSTTLVFTIPVALLVSYFTLMIVFKWIPLVRIIKRLWMDSIK